MSLPVWFVIIAVFWTGFFVLEGFDFGVGALHTFRRADDTEQRVAINTIGPFWDGNEVWLIVAAPPSFAAFPGWYATWFSALYLALLLILLALIMRGVSFEFRGHHDSARWRGTWSRMLTAGSVARTAAARSSASATCSPGCPSTPTRSSPGVSGTCSRPTGCSFGVTLLALCLLHGSSFLALKGAGAVHARAHRFAAHVALGRPGPAVAFAIWTYASSGRSAMTVASARGLGAGRRRCGRGHRGCARRLGVHGHGSGDRRDRRRPVRRTCTRT